MVNQARNHNSQSLRKSAFAVLVTLLAAPALSGCHRNAAPPASGNGDSGATLVAFKTGTALKLDANAMHLAGISTAVAGLNPLAATIRPTGQITATDTGSVQVLSRLPGRINAVLVKKGDHVRVGQVLCTVDSVDLANAEAAYQQALSHEHLTADQLQQQRKLAAYGMLSEQSVEDAQRAQAAAQAAVKGDQAQLALDGLTLNNTQKLVSLGEITQKPLEDAQNAYAQAHAALQQALVALNSAHQNLDRTKTLYRAGVFSLQNLEDAQTAYNTALSARNQDQVQDTLANQELARQKSIQRANLNGTASLQAAESKLQQDRHQYQSDLITLGATRKELARAQLVHKSGIPVSQALQTAEDSDAEAQLAVQGAAQTLRLYGIQPGQAMMQLAAGHVVVPVVSPMEGILTEPNMVVGQLTDTSTPLARVVNLARVYVNAQVYEHDLPSIATGDPITATVTALPNSTFTGVVKYVGNSVDPNTRTAGVVTEISNPDWLLRPGMFATVSIHPRSASRRLAIPADAVLLEGEQTVVFVEVAADTFVKRAVRVGASVSGDVPVYSGISPGDRVVTSGNVLLENEQQELATEKGSAA
ncbi:MAG: efflux RND transporter periplasmic adaptor subunit [Armatimonadetes bacterium]|nr:efflux RND transporter periplasmic adaptor subunit [Armatimonadota bacterium]MDE2205598.1 efflux RND transporter periplasmic adaptor subunit [Armatimonadota bacterium]